MKTKEVAKLLVLAERALVLVVSLAVCGVEVSGSRNAIAALKYGDHNYMRKHTRINSIPVLFSYTIVRRRLIVLLLVWCTLFLVRSCKALDEPKIDS